MNEMRLTNVIDLHPRRSLPTEPTSAAPSILQVIPRHCSALPHLRSSPHRPDKAAIVPDESAIDQSFGVTPPFTAIYAGNAEASVELHQIGSPPPPEADNPACCNCILPLPYSTP
ncbi:hypothetical protein C8Q80DRAFT_449546 [Daedaleopsis nitida]|nr:hypothetical protein C8Q80DRAFT_449546 [Daedaleopsis nitida]